MLGVSNIFHYVSDVIRTILVVNELNTSQRVEVPE